MRFVETPIAGLMVVELEPRTDDRGFFSRTYCEDEFRAHGLHTHWPQHNLSYNEHVGTVRGMHYQRAPHEEPKLVRCSRGRIWDVAVDLRPSSPTYRRWFGVELSDRERNALYVGVGFAHGFQTLTDHAEVTYLMGERYSPDHAAGVRWNDPTLGIAWPRSAAFVSPRDAAYPDLADPR